MQILNQRLQNTKFSNRLSWDYKSNDIVQFTCLQFIFIMNYYFYAFGSAVTYINAGYPTIN